MKHVLALLMILVCVACVKRSNIPVVKKSKPVPVSYQEEGIASWYGGQFHGRKTASGEKFNKHDLTCAHRTLPFGTLVTVINLDNEKEVTVRVNDRGPAIKSRLIDLSQAAAKVLGFIGEGVAKVRVTDVASVDQPVAPEAPDQKTDQRQNEVQQDESPQPAEKSEIVQEIERTETTHYE